MKTSSSISSWLSSIYSRKTFIIAEVFDMSQNNSTRAMLIKTKVLTVLNKPSGPITFRYIQEWYH